MAAGARIYREITWLNVAWKNEKWAVQKRNLLNILAVRQSGLIYEQYQAIFLQTDFWVIFFLKLEV